MVASVMGLPRALKKVQNTLSSFELSKPAHDGLGRRDGWMRRNDKSLSLAVSADYDANMELWTSFQRSL